MKRLLVLLMSVIAAPAFAQATDPHAGHHMPATAPEAPSDPHAGHDMADMPDAAEPTGTDQSPGSAEAPPVVHDSPAARYWDAKDMAAAAAAEMHPPQPLYSKLTVDLAELRVHDGRDGYAWEAEAWVGDLNRFMLKTKGEGSFGEALDHGEMQALYAKALDPWWNLQAGLRQDIGAGPQRSWATLGVEGRVPYQFEVQAAAFLSDKGQVTGRIEAAYDQRITQKLILQPRVELNLSAQDMPAAHIGDGLTSAELGLRLRYEIRREFAPYIGAHWGWSVGKTADYARAEGKDTRDQSLVAGIRFWF